MCKWIRETEKISQYKLADLLETTQTNVSFIERGFIPPERLQKKIIILFELTYERKCKKNVSCDNGNI